MIKKVIKNKAQAQTQRENGLVVYPTEEILGSIKSVKDFAAFYVTHKTDLEVVKSHFLLEYCESALFTPEQLNAFRMGLDAWMKLFESTEADTKSYLLQAETQKRTSVG